MPDYDSCYDCPTPVIQMLTLRLLLWASLAWGSGAVKCYVDNQGIPLEEAAGIIAEFKVSNQGNMELFDRFNMLCVSRQLTENIPEWS